MHLVEHLQCRTHNTHTSKKVAFDRVASCPTGGSIRRQGYSSDVGTGCTNAPAYLNGELLRQRRAWIIPPRHWARTKSPMSVQSSASATRRWNTLRRHVTLSGHNEVELPSELLPVRRLGAIRCGRWGRWEEHHRPRDDEEEHRHGRRRWKR